MPSIDEVAQLFGPAERAENDQCASFLAHGLELLSNESLSCLIVTLGTSSGPPQNMPAWMWPCICSLAIHGMTTIVANRAELLQAEKGGGE